MADNAQTATDRELAINANLDTLDNSLEEGPDDGEAPEAFLKRLVKESEEVTKAIRLLSPDDIDEIFIEGESDNDDDESEED